MSLSVGLIGLPNAGKSTTFNVLAGAPLAQTAAYPFTTVEPNRTLVEVPDDRLTVLGDLTGQQERIPVRFEVLDIAGLVKGASRGEGLGNRFLAQVRECDALLHVVGCFDRGGDSMQGDPLSNLEVVHQELILSDLQILETRIGSLTREVKGDRSLAPVLDMAMQLRAWLEDGRPANRHGQWGAQDAAQLDQGLGLASGKPELVLLNHGDAEDGVSREMRPEEVATGMELQGHRTVLLDAAVESELLELPEEDRELFRQELGLVDSGLDRVVTGCFGLLGLIRFYTLGDAEVRAWELRNGSSAVEAAGRIHTDFARGFIGADVVDFPSLQQAGSERRAREKGIVHTEGRTYQVVDGDVIRFRFNV